jgi:hypothetical protein
MTDSVISTLPSAAEAILIPHAEFRQGLAAGHFRLIVDPQRVRKFVRHRLLVMPISLAMTGIGIALALSAHPFWGVALVATGVILNRVISAQAAKILLHLVVQDERTYLEAMEFAILEVRRAP